MDDYIKPCWKIITGGAMLMYCGYMLGAVEGASSFEQFTFIVLIIAGWWLLL